MASVTHPPGSMPVSPHSSNGPVSTHGTPDTRLTAFTPEGASARALRGKSHAQPHAQGRPLFDARGFYSAHSASGAPASSADPFYSGSSTDTTAKPSSILRATTPAFKPSGAGRPAIVNGSQDAGTATALHVLEHTLQSSASAWAPPPLPDSISIAQCNAVSSATGLSRVLRFTAQRETSAELVIQNCQAKLQQHGRGVFRFDREHPHVYIRLSDLRDTAWIYSVIMRDHPTCLVSYCSPHSLPINSQRLMTMPTTICEGQVVVETLQPSSTPALALAKHVLTTLQQKGDVFAFQEDFSSGNGYFKFVAEYCDTRHAVQAAADLHNTSLGFTTMSVKLHQPDVLLPYLIQQQVNNPPSAGISPVQGWDYVGPHNGSHAHHHVSSPGGVMTPGFASQGNLQYALVPAVAMPYQHSGDGQQQVVSLHGSRPPSSNGQNSLTYSASSTPSQHSVVARLPGRNLRENAVRTQRTHDDRVQNRSSTHNVVDPGRIKAGVDVRTTIMLRNIPNKMQQAELKDIVDTSSFGKYDFMYLRIDFQNECNVGYAFINFVDPLDIVDFWDARAGTSWGTHGSSKIAEISYATIQGKDCLVSKFRNSSVMLEAPEYRPKIFFTIGHPFSGYEEEFPDSDNHSKMRRSIDNAEHVGLFAPRDGQQVRQDQRRNRSLYDRGTLPALMEEDEHDHAYFNCKIL